MLIAKYIGFQQKSNTLKTNNVKNSRNFGFDAYKTFLIQLGWIP